MIKNLLFLFIGFIISHLLTAILLAILYSKAFYIYSPFTLVSYYLHALLSFRPVTRVVQLMFWFYLIVSTIPLGIYQMFCGDSNSNKSGKKDKYGYAKFASNKLIRKMGLNFDKGVVFGLVRRYFPFGKRMVIRSNQPLSTLIIAPTGTGKTAGFIIPTLKSITNSVVAFDIKGELFQTTNQDRVNLGHQVLVFQA